MQLGTLQKEEMSYALYKNIATDLYAPIDMELALDIRIELYQSKLVFLRNLYAQAFKEVNGGVVHDGFCDGDLVSIRQSLLVTEDFMRRDCVELVKASLDLAHMRMSQAAL